VVNGRAVAWPSGGTGLSRSSHLRVIVNGQDREVADGSAIADLISQLDLKAERVAVELNRKILRRIEWSEATLNDGDRVEIVHFVGGGC